MDLNKLKDLVDKIAGHPALHERIARYRADRPADSSKLLDAVTSALTMVATGTSFVGGKKTKQIGTAAGTIVLLVELSIIIKREVIEDPEIQQMFKNAWSELEAQSAAAAELGRGLIAQAGKIVGAGGKIFSKS